MAEGPDVVDEVVDIRGEEGEEAGVTWLVCGGLACVSGSLVLNFFSLCSFVIGIR